MVTIQKYVKAQSLEEAWKLNQGKKNRILGGMLWMRLGNGTISTAIDLCDLGLDTIEETDEEFSIGARVTLRELEQHVGLNTYTHDAVKNAVKDIVGVQFRNGDNRRKHLGTLWIFRCADCFSDYGQLCGAL